MCGLSSNFDALRVLEGKNRCDAHGVHFGVAALGTHVALSRHILALALNRRTSHFPHCPLSCLRSHDKIHRAISEQQGNSTRRSRQRWCGTASAEQHGSGCFCVGARKVRADRIEYYWRQGAAAAAGGAVHPEDVQSVRCDKNHRQVQARSVCSTFFGACGAF
jgi:hypothetical protein